MFPPERIVCRPDISIGSWCGKKFRAEKGICSARFRTDTGRPTEIKSPIILQPGPATLTDGLKALQAIIEKTA
jgi:iron complex transport system substrate-binding protein